MNNLFKPTGLERIQYINDGYALCPACGSIMDYSYERYSCPSCGRVETQIPEYFTNVEWTKQTLSMYKRNVPPTGCRMCGGPYPSCTTSCSIHDM